MAGVLVFCEIKDGKVKKASREALSSAGRPFTSVGTKVSGPTCAYEASRCAALVSSEVMCS